MHVQEDLLDVCDCLENPMLYCSVFEIGEHCEICVTMSLYELV